MIIYKGVKRQVYLRRVLYALANGQIGAGMWVRHPIGGHAECSDPAHLAPFVRSSQRQSAANDHADALKRLEFDDEPEIELEFEKPEKETA